MNKIILSLAAVLILFTACRKETPNTSVSGTVEESVSHTGIAYAKVRLLALETNCYSCVPSEVASYDADASGAYSFEFSQQEGYVYEIRAKKEKYFDSTTGVSITAGEKNTAVRIMLDAEAYLKLYVKNTSPFDGNDKIIITGDWSGGLYDNVYDGTGIDTVVYKTVRAGSQVKVNWAVTKNSITAPYSAALNCSALDTTFYNINY